MKYSSKPGGPGMWPKRLMAVFGSVMLVLSLIPSQGLAEALTELGAIEGDGIEVVADEPDQPIAYADSQDEGIEEVADDLPASEEDVVATTQADDNPFLFTLAYVPYKNESGVETSYDSANQEITWKASFNVPAAGLGRATITDVLPSGTVNGVSYRDTLYDDFDVDVVGVPSNDTPFVGPEETNEKIEREEIFIAAQVYSLKRTADGFVVDFYEGLPKAGSEYVITVTVRTSINQEWYSAATKAENHTNKATLTVSGYDTSFEASATVRVNPANCSHGSGKYTAVNTAVHRWNCNNCDYYREEAHEWTTSGAIKCKKCGMEGVKVSYSAGDGTGSMANQFFGKGHEYVLPTPTNFKGPNGQSFNRWEVKVGSTAAQNLYAGDVVELTDNTTLKAIWSASINYIDENGETKTHVGYENVTSATSSLGKGWYVVKGNVNLKGKGVIAIDGDTKLILCQNSKLTTDGIKVNTGSIFTVYGETEQAGTIDVDGAKVGVTNAGRFRLFGGTISGATEAGVLTEGEFVLGGGLITNNAVGVKYGNTLNAVVSVRGKPRVQNNTDGNDVYLRAGKYIDVAGALKTGASIGVKLDVEAGRLITRGYGDSGSPDDPSSIFRSSSSVLRIANETKDGEVQLYDPSAVYLDKNGEIQRIMDYKPLSSIVDFAGNPTSALKYGWYTVDKNTTFSSRLIVDGDVTLVLYDKATLTCNDGIQIKRGSLTVYAQSAYSAEEGDASVVGKIVATATTEGYAGIGGNNGESNAKLVVYGGIVSATGASNGAGIGGGAGGDGGSIDVFGGKIVATGGQNAAGIGGGATAEDQEGLSGAVTVYGGEVEAKGGLYAAGIGGGNNGYMDTIMVRGGKVTATGGDYGAGIGAGRKRSASGTFATDGGTTYAQGGAYAAGIGGGELGDGGKVVIAGTAHVTAKGGRDAAGIGGGDDGAGGDVSLNGGSCSVFVESDEDAEGIGRGDQDTLNSGKLVFEKGNMLWVTKDGSDEHVLAEEREAAMRSTVAQATPCEHPGHVSEFTYTVEGHNGECDYCDLNNAKPEPHQFNEDGVCVCGAVAGKVDFLAGNGGKGTMPSGTYVVDRDYYFPECAFEPAEKGTFFAYWLVDGVRYNTGESIKLDTSKVITATAVWTKKIKYIGENGSEVETGYYNYLRETDTEWKDGTYVLDEGQTLTIPTSIQVVGKEVNLILRDGTTLNVGEDLHVNKNAELNIYWQSGKSGKLCGPKDLIPGVVDDDNGFLWNDGDLYVYGGNISGYACIDNCFLFYMYDGNVTSTDWSISNSVNSYIYGGTVNGGEWGITVYSGSFVMRGGTVQGSTENVEINKGGRFELEGGTIQDAKTYGVRVYEGGRFVLRGNPVFQNNSVADAMLEKNTTIHTDKLSEDFAMTVALRTTRGTITTDFQKNNPYANPSDIFFTNDEALTVTLKNGEAVIVGDAKYYDENAEVHYCSDYTEFKNSTPKIDGDLSYLNAGWYVVAGDVQVTNTLVIQNEVNLVLEDGAKLEATKGIRIPEGAKLNVWGGEEGTGTLTAVSGTSGQAGIGAENMDSIPGAFTLHRGNVVATGGRSAAGIQCSHGSTVEILGGSVITSAGRAFAKAIGAANDGQAGVLTLANNLAVHATGSLVKAAERVGVCGSSPQIQIDPCKHADYEYVTTSETHQFVCHNCLVQNEAAAHEFNAEQACTVCGYKDIVTISFEPGELGTGTMDEIKVPRNTPFNMPTCTFNHPDGVAFAGWQVEDKIMAIDAPYSTDKDLTLTATWTSGFKVFAYSKLDTSSANVADIQMSPMLDSYPDGYVVKLTAPAKNGYEFKGWFEVLAIDNEGRVTSTANDVLCQTLVYNLTVTNNMSVCAVYAKMSSVKVDIIGNARFKVNGQGKGTASYTGRLPSGSVLNVAMVDDLDVIYWKDDFNRIISTESEFSMTLVADTSITLTCDDGDGETSSFVKWVSTSGQVFAGTTIYTDQSADEIADYIPLNGPSKYGYKFEKWVFSDTKADATAEAIKERIGTMNVINLEPTYSKLDAKYSLTLHYVHVDADNRLTEIAKSDAYSHDIGYVEEITAKNIPGYTFVSWMNDEDMTIGYTKNYIMQYTRNKDLYVRYIAEGEVLADEDMPKPVIYLRRFTPTDTTGESLRFAVSATRCIPNDGNWTVISAGLIGKDGFNNPTEDNFVITNSSLKSMKVSEKDLARLVQIQKTSVNAANNLDTVWTFRAYMGLRNNNTGNVEYFYSNIRSMSFNQIMEQFNSEQ